MVRSGLQAEILKLYRRGVRNAFSKPPDRRREFLLHWRYNFRNPQLGPRDYAAIEYQLRKMSRVLEMLEDSSVQRVSLSSEMEHWWEGQVRKSTSTADPTHPGSATGHSQPDADRQQWSHTLPGHGGT